MSAAHGETAQARLAAALDAFEAGEDARMATPASEEDLKRVEERLGHALPASLRALLLRVGAGLFARGHEVFGPTRVMVHDIELVPDMLSVYARLLDGGRITASEVPFHRLGDVLHVMCTTGPSAGSVSSVPRGETYGDLATFLQTMVRPPATAEGRSP